MYNPVVNIIIPAYNAEKCISRCIQSLFSQTYKTIEIIVIDDGSKDDTEKICKLAKQCDDRLMYVRQKNQGPSVARNKGIKLATGEYLMFVDSDDQLIASAVQILVDGATKSRPDLISFDFDVINSQGKIERKDLAVKGQYPQVSITTGQECLRHIYAGDGIGNFSWAFFYSLFFLRESGVSFDENIHLLEDALFLNRLLRRATIVQYYDRYFIGSPSSLTQTIDFKNVSGGVNAVSAIAELAQNDGFFSEFRPHGIDLLFFLGSRIGFGNRLLKNMHKQIRSEIVSWYKRGGGKGISIKALIKISLIRIRTYDCVAQIARVINRGLVFSKMGSRDNGVS